MSALPMSEDQLQDTVIGMCRALGLLVAHFRPAQVRPGKWVTPVQADGAGFPDLIIVGGCLLAWELKSDIGRIGRPQWIWIDALARAQVEVAIIRPSDLRSGLVERQLKACAGKQEPS